MASYGRTGNYQLPIDLARSNGAMLAQPTKGEEHQRGGGGFLNPRPPAPELSYHSVCAQRAQTRTNPCILARGAWS